MRNELHHLAHEWDVSDAAVARAGIAQFLAKYHDKSARAGRKPRVRKKAMPA
jgi:hypothetical protein